MATAPIIARPVVVGAMTRGLAIFRPLALAYAVLMAWLERDQMRAPSAAVATYAVLGVWTLIASLRRTLDRPAVLIDLALAVGGIIATNVAFPRDVVVGGVMTLPSIWSATGVIGAGILGGERWGLAAAGLISVADIVGVVEVNQGTIHNIVLLILSGGLIGLSARLARESQGFFEASVRAEEAYAERERLSRAVHDGVLQTLTYINRRGRELGPGGAELAELAREQERSLRSLVTRGTALPSARTREDLAARLRSLQSDRVEVSMPAESVSMPGERCDELLAAVGAALDNALTHGGPQARVWVLLEDLGDDIEVTIRDNGVGMPPGRLAEARSAGRLGASQSIRGRLEDLGGSATWRSQPGKGCTVGLRAPKERTAVAVPAKSGASTRHTEGRT